MIKGRKCICWHRENPNFAQMFLVKLLIKTYVDLCKSGRSKSHLQLSFVEFLAHKSKFLEKTTVEATLTERDVVSARRRAHSRTFLRDAPPPERAD
jgi:hypothetical protein